MRTAAICYRATLTFIHLSVDGMGMSTALPVNKHACQAASKAALSIGAGSTNLADTTGSLVPH
jgi:hypothetical protein